MCQKKKPSVISLTLLLALSPPLLATPFDFIYRILPIDVVIINLFKHAQRDALVRRQCEEMLTGANVLNEEGHRMVTAFMSGNKGPVWIPFFNCSKCPIYCQH